MLLVDFLKDYTVALEAIYPAKEAQNIVLMLCESKIGTKSYTHIVDPSYKIDDSKMMDLLASMDRLKQGEPIQYVLGYTEFCGRTYKVNKSVLIPRPETEQLINDNMNEAARWQRMRSIGGKNAVPVRVLDLCTGSGCVAWTMALGLPGSKVVGVDISDEALYVARTQFSTTQKNKDVSYIAPEFIKADILDSEQEFKYDEFDLILGNPPYIMEKEKSLMRKNVLDFEPEIALFVPDDDPLVFYRAIARWSQRFLSASGRAMIEINELLGHETAELFEKAGFKEVRIVKDIFGKQRFISYHK